MGGTNGAITHQRRRDTWLPVYGKDITEKKKIELELKESEQERKENQSRLEAILENTTSLIFIKNLDGKYIMINRRFREVMGVTDEMVINKTDYDFSEKETADHYKRLDDEVISTRKPVETEEWIFGPEGRKNLLVIKFPLIDHKRKILVSVVSLPILPTGYCISRN